MTGGGGGGYPPPPPPGLPSGRRGGPIPGRGDGLLGGLPRGGLAMGGIGNRMPAGFEVSEERPEVSGWSLGRVLIPGGITGARPAPESAAPRPPAGLS